MSRPQNETGQEIETVLREIETSCSSIQVNLDESRTIVKSIDAMLASRGKPHENEE